jgi:hypothetical protein
VGRHNFKKPVSNCVVFEEIHVRVLICIQSVKIEWERVCKFVIEFFFKSPTRFMNPKLLSCRYFDELRE